MKNLALYLLVLVMTGCADPRVQEMPAKIIGAPEAQAHMTEVMPVEQVLRPQDVLEVIFHIGTASADQYRVQPGDQLEIAFLSTPNLNGNKQVAPDGSIEMPYIGTIKLAGETAEEARQTLESQYSRVLKKPRITVSITHAMSQMDNLRASLASPSSGMTRDLMVGKDGRVTFPLIGALALQGKTLSEVQKNVSERYAKENPLINVDVMLKSTNANQVFVLGEVAQPGAYPIQRPVSVLEALSLAHGTSPTARLDSVVIMRRQGNQVEARVYDADAALDGKALQFAYLQPDDMLYVPKTRLAKASQLTRQMADLVLFQGIGLGFSYRLDNKNNINN